MVNFKAGGAISPADGCYITRYADELVARNLRENDFTHIVEPRQQGKSSLINRLKDPEFGLGKVIVDIKANNYKPSQSENWYSLIGSEILRQVNRHPDLLPPDSGIEVPRDGNDWNRFLSDLALQVTRDTVIVLDEVDAIRFPGSDQFYSVIRNVGSDLQNRRIRFLLSGCFHPHDLVQDPAVSPFNTGNRVELKDFDRDQVRKLASMGSWGDEPGRCLADRVYYWTDGHPYITQSLFHSLLPNASSPDDVDTAVQRWISHDLHNLPRIVNGLRTQPDLDAELRQILNGKQITLSDYDAHAPHTRLRLLGVIKEDELGFCIIRNRIYRRVFRRDEDRSGVFISYRHVDWHWAHGLETVLTAKGVKVSRDAGGMRGGDAYRQKLLDQIESSHCFVVVLTEGALDRCHEPGDWLCLEIAHALASRVRVIPTLIEPCHSPTADQLPKEIKALAKLHTIRVAKEGFATAAAAIHEQCAHGA